MYFVYREGLNFRTVKGRGYKIGYAYSNDLINWTRDDNMSGIDYQKWLGFFYASLSTYFFFKE